MVDTSYAIEATPQPVVPATQVNDAPSLAAPLASAPADPRELTTDEELERQAAAPDASEVISAGFRQSNLIGSAAANKTSAMTRNYDPAFSLRKSLEGEKNAIYMDNWQSFHNVFNQDDFNLVKSQIDMEEKDKQTLAGAGWGGTFASVAAGTLDPTFLIPMLGEVNGARTAINVGRAAMRTGLSVAGAVGVQEAGLHGTQATRTGQESAMAVGSSLLLGGLLGAAGKLFLPGERATAEAALQRLNTPEGSTVGPASAGAAARDVLSREDLTVSGQAAGAVADATSFLNPVLRGNTSPSAVVREASQGLYENTMYQFANEEGRTPGIAAETAIRVEREAANRLPEAVGMHDAAFKEAKLSGVDMNAEDFSEAVSRAMRRSDVGVNDYVSRAAQSWRKAVVDPLKNTAIELGLLPADVKIETAPSYFTRMWNVPKLLAQEGDVKARFQAHFDEQMKGEFADDISKLQVRQSKIAQEIADLKLAPADRLKTTEGLRAEQDQLFGNNPDHVDRADQINDLRQQVADANERAKNAADSNARKAAKDQAASAREMAANLKKEGGAAFKVFTAKRAELNTRQRNVELGYAAMSDKRDMIAGQLADLNEANLRSMTRLIKKGQKFQQDLQRVAPEAVAERVSQLRESFAAEAAKAERQAEKFKGQAEKLREAQKEGKDVGAAGADLLDRQAKAEGARADRLNSIVTKLEIAESLDPQAMANELQNGVSKLVDEVSNVSLSRGEHAQRLQEKMASLDPKKVDDRLKSIEAMRKDFERRHMEKWEIARGVDGAHLPPGEQDFSEYTKDIVNAIFDKLTGRGFDNNIPDNIVPATRGPLKERTFNIPDEKVEDFLENDVKHVMENYVRKMTSDIELTRKFGSADMKDVLTRVQRDYDGLRESVIKASTPDEVRAIALNNPGLLKRLVGKGDANKSLEQIKEDTLTYLRKSEKTDMEDLQAGRDMMRGNYKPANMNTVWGRTVKAGLQYNFITRMGTVVLSNVSEIFRPAMVYGMKPFLEHGISPLLTNLKSVGVQNALREVKLAGVATERALQHRIQSFAEMGDPYARGTAAERLLQNGSRLGMRWSGLSGWTDLMKSISGVLAQDRIIRLAQDGSDIKTLSFLGMNSAMRDRVADQIGKFAKKEDGAWSANTELWSDPEAIRHFRAALNKDVSSVIVTRSVGDVPLFANTPTGKIITQFKGFALASHQRVLIRGLQEGPARFMSGLISMSIAGMMATYLRALASNRLDKLPGADNVGWWIGEGIDNTGILSVPMELANDFEKPTGINPLKDPLRAAGRALTGATAKPESFRNTNRNGPGALLGPSFGMASDLFNVLGTMGAHASGAKVGAGQNKSAVNSAANLTPFYSYPLFRQIMDYGIKPAAADALGAK